MEPIVTPKEMAAIDAESSIAGVPVSQLIDRAGWATAQVAARLLAGRVAGRRVAVLAGRGNNGADGRAAARYLDRRGATCTVIDFPGPSSVPNVDFDLVIDGCVGTGLTRPFDAGMLPLHIGETPVLAVDIPSGVDGLTGQIPEGGHPLCAAATVTFAAWKPGLLLAPGRHYTGVVTVADIGLDPGRATMHLATGDDVAQRWPRRGPDGHKWQQAVYVVGGSVSGQTTMTGAPALAATAALRAGAGMVAVAVPGSEAPVAGSAGPIEAVGHPTPTRWATPVLERLERNGRFGAAVVGPGLAHGRERVGHGAATGIENSATNQVATYLAATETPTVFDAGALPGLAAARAAAVEAPTGGSAGAGGRAVRHVLTPHEGEFATLFASLFGRLPGVNRVDAVRLAAERFGMVVLLKGATTIVAEPGGRVALCDAGDQRLATAGTGDVLAGVIAAGMAGGLDPFAAATLGSVLHGRAASRGYRVGMLAGDLPSLVAAELSELTGG